MITRFQSQVNCSSGNNWSDVFLMPNSPRSEVHQPSSSPAQCPFWTVEMEVTLLEALLKDAGEGKRADGGFKKTTWENALKGLCNNYLDVSIGKRQVESKVDGLKEKY